MLMVAIGHQAGLAIENTMLYEAKIQAERLAAVGQTIATLSHHIKNILQGMRGGSYLVDLGLNDKDDAIVRRGWGIVDKNQAKIYNLVMDMLSFSKERQPALELADLNETIGDVIELMQSRAAELGVGLAWEPAADLRPTSFDPDGIHRAALNIVTNAIDACEGVEGGRVAVATAWDEPTATARVVVRDNGSGIEPGEMAGSSRSSPRRRGRRGPAWACRSRKRSSASTAARSPSPPRSGRGRPSRSSSPPPRPTRPRTRRASSRRCPDSARARRSCRPGAGRRSARPGRSRAG